MANLTVSISDELKRKIDELHENVSDIKKYSGLKEEEIDAAIAVLKSLVIVVEIESFEEFKNDAEKASPDPKDAPFFALALRTGAGIWSNEPRLKKQSAVKV